MHRCLWGPTANLSKFPSKIYPLYVRPFSSYQFAYFAHICNTATALRLFQHHTGFGAPKHQEWVKTSLMPFLLSSPPFFLILKNCPQLYPKDLDHNSAVCNQPESKVFLQVPFSAHRAQHFEKTETITADVQLLRLYNYSKLQGYLAVPSATLHTTQELLLSWRNTENSTWSLRQIFL